MSLPQPAVRRSLVGILAGMAASGLVAVHGHEGLPAVRTYALVLTPVPLVLAVAHGRALGAGAGFGVCAVMLGVTPIGRDLPLGAFLVGCGAIVAYVFAVVRGAPGMNGAMLGGVVLALGLAALHLAAVAAEHDRSSVEEYRAQLAASEQQLTASEAWDELPAEQRDQIQRMLPAMRLLAPAIVIGQYVSGLALACWTSLFLLRRTRFHSWPPLNFGAWRLPEWCIFTFIAPAVALLLGVAREWPTVQAVAGNTMAVVVGLYLVQGCAIVHSLLRRLRVHPLLEALLYPSMVFVLPPLLLVVTVAGLFDFLVDFRGRWEPAPPAPDEPRPNA